MAREESINAIRGMIEDIPSHSKDITTIEKKLIKQQIKQIKNESRNRRGRGSRQKIHEKISPIPEKTEKTEREI